MAISKIRIKVTVAWWWRLYVYGVIFTSMITGLEPDMDKVEAVILKALRTEVA